MFCFAKQVHLLKDSDDCYNLMKRKIRSKRGALILYRKTKLYQIFLPPSATVHQRAGFSLEYMLWGKFFLPPAQGGSCLKSRSSGFATQEDGIGEPLTQTGLQLLLCIAMMNLSFEVDPERQLRMSQLSHQSKSFCIIWLISHKTFCSSRVSGLASEEFKHSL